MIGRRPARLAALVLGPALLAITLATAAPAAGRVGQNDSAAEATEPVLPVAPLTHNGRWLRDATGRVLLLHGVNMVNKLPPYDPATAGFDAPDAAFLDDVGLKLVRVGLIWKAVEPSPGVYDDGYLERIADTVDLLGRHGIVSLLGFHQDLLNERFLGEGFPDWAVQDDGLPATPDGSSGYTPTYTLDPGENAAWNHFWLNSPGPGGVGLQDRYAEAWRHVAARFRDSPYVLGYDLFNEPWPGSQWPTCGSPVGCPVFEQQFLGPFQQRVTARIRTADTRHPIWYEPSVTTQFGTEYWVPNPGDANAGMSFHVYCLAGGAPVVQTPACDRLEQISMDNAGARAAANGDPYLLSEFGATDDLSRVEPLIGMADRAMVSWAYWAYWNADPTGPQPQQGIVNDLHRPPAGSNLKPAKVRALAEVYPYLVAGTPSGYAFDAASRTFSLRYSTARVDGTGAFRAGSTTYIVVPAIQYPDGYGVRVTGGRVVSAPGAGLLQVAACPGAAAVTVEVAPGAGVRGGC